MTALLERLSVPSPSPSRGDAFEVESGLLICGCGRWFPIDGCIPELLPDHLRDAKREDRFLDTVTEGGDATLIAMLRRFTPGESTNDAGAHYKQAEISIRNKVDEPMFFVPGQTSPFAPWDSDFSLYLIKLFGAAAPLLNLKRGEVVVDSGCGYAWTTEWLSRSGFEAIGVDICRTYLEIGAARMGPSRPHLIVCDVESLPLQDGTARAVLAYESFHHIPDRRRTLAEYQRILEDAGTVVLAEPGAAHETAQVAVDAMKKYGILEKGMELTDVHAYAEGTTFSVEQLFLARVGTAELGARLEPDFVRTHSVVEGNLFRLVKGRRQSEPTSVPSPARPQQGLLSRLKKRLRPAIQPRDTPSNVGP